MRCNQCRLFNATVTVSQQYFSYITQYIKESSGWYHEQGPSKFCTMATRLSKSPNWQCWGLTLILTLQCDVGSARCAKTINKKVDKLQQMRYGKIPIIWFVFRILFFPNTEELILSANIELGFHWRRKLEFMDSFEVTVDNEASKTTSIQTINTYGKYVFV